MTLATTERLAKWDNAKSQLRLMDFPEPSGPPPEVAAGEYHMEGKQMHPLKTYRLDLKPILGFPVQAKWNYCEKCKEIRNKMLVISNGDNSSVFIKWFVKHGRISPQ